MIGTQTAYSELTICRSADRFLKGINRLKKEILIPKEINAEKIPFNIPEFYSWRKTKTL